MQSCRDSCWSCSEHFLGWQTFYWNTRATHGQGSAGHKRFRATGCMCLQRIDQCVSHEQSFLQRQLGPTGTNTVLKAPKRCGISTRDILHSQKDILHSQIIPLDELSTQCAQSKSLIKECSICAFAFTCTVDFWDDILRSYIVKWNTEVIKDVAPDLKKSAVINTDIVLMTNTKLPLLPEKSPGWALICTGQIKSSCGSSDGPPEDMWPFQYAT